MNLSLGYLPESIRKNACLVVGVSKNLNLSWLTQLDDLLDGLVSKTIFASKLNFDFGDNWFLPQIENQNISQLLLIGLGSDEALAPSKYLQLYEKSLRILQDKKIFDIQFLFPEIKVKNQNLENKIRLAVLGISNGLYEFNKFKTSKNKRSVPEQIDLLITTQEQLPVLQPILTEAQAIAGAVCATRDLGNGPANVVSTQYLENYSRELAERYPKITCHVYDEAQLKQLGMEAFLAVSSGKPNSGRMIVLEYQGAEMDHPYVLVGKGITFDTGGYVLKPKAAMNGMKYDMCGAASVLGTLQALADLHAPVRVVGILACAENMISQFAMRVDDIVKSMSGQTIEITNTDAEGRLVLCDALTFCERFNPKQVIDIATLTGACVTALGYRYAGFFTNQPELFPKFFEAGQQTQDLVWQLPLDEEYQSLLSSKYADILNCSLQPIAGSVTAACFLSKFTTAYSWVHLDVAGAAFNSEQGATGRPVPLLVQYILNDIKEVNNNG